MHDDGSEPTEQRRRSNPCAKLSMLTASRDSRRDCGTALAPNEKRLEPRRPHAVGESTPVRHNENVSKFLNHGEYAGPSGFEGMEMAPSAKIGSGSPRARGRRCVSLSHSYLGRLDIGAWILLCHGASIVILHNSATPAGWVPRGEKPRCAGQFCWSRRNANSSPRTRHGHGMVSLVTLLEWCGPVPAQSWVKLVGRAAELLRIHFVPYMCRNSGPSWDRLQKHRTLQERQKRGWVVGILHNFSGRHFLPWCHDDRTARQTSEVDWSASVTSAQVGFSVKTSYHAILVLLHSGTHALFVRQHFWFMSGDGAGNAQYRCMLVLWRFLLVLCLNLADMRTLQIFVGAGLLESSVGHVV